VAAARLDEILALIEHRDRLTRERDEWCRRASEARAKAALATYDTKETQK